MNAYTRLIAAAAAVLLVAVLAYQFLPGRSGAVGQASTVPSAAPTTAPSSTTAPDPTAAASPTPALSLGPSGLAKGSFTSHGVAAQVDATGAGANVVGTMTVSDAGKNATVALECTRTTDAGLIEIGGLVTESTFDDGFPRDYRVAIVIQRGPPVKAVWQIALVSEAKAASCQALLDGIDPAAVTPDLEPISGTVLLAP